MATKAENNSRQNENQRLMEINPHILIFLLLLPLIVTDHLQFLRSFQPAPSILSYTFTNALFFKYNRPPLPWLFNKAVIDSAVIAAISPKIREVLFAPAAIVILRQIGTLSEKAHLGRDIPDFLAQLIHKNPMLAVVFVFMLIFAKKITTLSLPKRISAKIGNESGDENYDREDDDQTEKFILIIIGAIWEAISQFLRRQHDEQNNEPEPEPAGPPPMIPDSLEERKVYVWPPETQENRP